MSTTEVPEGSEKQNVPAPVYQQRGPGAPRDVDTTYPTGYQTPIAERSITDLLADVADPDAWNEIVERYAGLVWAVARGFRLDDATTADVTQQTWLTLVEHRHKIRDPERLGGWLATTTRRAAIRALHRRDAERPSEHVETDLDARDAFGDVADALEDAETRAEVRRAFAALSESCQLLLRLCIVEPKMEYIVIADLVGRPVGSLGPTRRRCLDLLRDLLTATLDEDS